MFTNVYIPILLSHFNGHWIALWMSHPSFVVSVEFGLVQDRGCCNDPYHLKNILNVDLHIEIKHRRVKTKGVVGTIRGLYLDFSFNCDHISVLTHSLFSSPKVPPHRVIKQDIWTLTISLWEIGIWET